MKNFSVLVTLLGLLIGSGNALAHDNKTHANKHRQEHEHHDDRYNDHYRDRNDDYSWCREDHDHAAYHGQRRYQAIARVVDIRPVYRYREQRHRSGCGYGYSSRRDHTGLVLGGIIGGVIGHEIGHGGYRGRHRDGATAAGVIIGAAAGNHYDRRHSNSNCDSYSRTSRKLDGYELTYSYRGKIRHTFVKRRPPSRFHIKELRRYQ